MGIMLLTPWASYTPGRCLQGKSDPSALIGELFKVAAPKGVGVTMVICAFAEVKSVMATATRVALAESILLLVLIWLADFYRCDDASCQTKSGAEVACVKVECK